MNKQELIENIKNISVVVSDTTINYRGVMVSMNEVLNIIKQLDEPEKPVVPQFVADFYESIKDDFEDKVYDLCVQYHLEESELNSDVAMWFGHSKNKPIETLVMMHKFGYEVKKAKLYTARLKLISVKKYSYINREKDEKRLFISDSDGLTDVYQTHFTQAELEELDVWNNSAFEFEEVEE